MAPVILQASLDGSYTGTTGVNGRRVLAYGGLVGFDEAWRSFSPIWEAMLNEFGVERFRTSDSRALPEFVRLRQSLGESIRRCGLHAVGCAADLDLLEARNRTLSKRDVFEHVVRQIERVAPSQANLALVCDREQDLAKEVAAWLERLRVGEDRSRP